MILNRTIFGHQTSTLPLLRRVTVLILNRTIFGHFPEEYDFIAVAVLILNRTIFGDEDEINRLALEIREF